MSIQARYAGFALDTSWYAHVGEDNAPELAYLALGLVGESGEFADAFKKIIREVGFEDEEAFKAKMADPEVRDILVGEAGDVLWYLTRICGFLELDLNALMVLNTYKLYKRLVERGKIDPKQTPWPFVEPSLADMHLRVVRDSSPTVGASADIHSIGGNDNVD